MHSNHKFFNALIHRGQRLHDRSKRKVGNFWRRRGRLHTRFEPLLKTCQTLLKVRVHDLLDHPQRRFKSNKDLRARCLGSVQHDWHLRTHLSLLWRLSWMLWWDQQHLWVLLPEDRELSLPHSLSPTSVLTTKIASRAIVLQNDRRDLIRGKKFTVFYVSIKYILKYPLHSLYFYVCEVKRHNDRLLC